MLHRRIHVCLFSLAACISAQELAAPTPEQAGPAKGRMWDDYNIVDSFETGYRFATVYGNQETYRSNVNFGNGIRLMSGFLSVNSKDGQGRFFDTIVLNVRGLATDPYIFASLRVQKNRLYDYRLSWRRNQYVNPGLVTDNAQGLHLEDTTYTLQDHDLTLFPQSAVRFILGYTHDNQQGAGISSIQLPDATGNIYPLFTNVKWSRNEYRVGNEIHLRGFTLNWTRGWQDFKDDTPYSATSAQAAGSPAVPTTLGNFLRGEPTHGTSPYWRVALFRDAKLYQLNGRFTYTGGNSAFVMNEMSAVLSPSDTAYNRQVFTLGNAKRPIATGNLSLAVSPFRKLTISEHLSLYNVRSEGNSAYLQYDNATQDSNILYFQSLGIRTMAAETDVAYQLSSRIDLTGTYEYSLRRITSVEQSAFGTSVSRLPYAQDDLLNTGSLGFRMRLVKGLTVSGGGEVGRSNRPFTPKGDRDYTDLFGRARYRWKTLQLSADAHSSYNANSITLSSYSSHGRTYSGSGSWSPAPWFSIDATYSKIHLDTVGGIAFFAGGQAFSNVDSYYISNLHNATLGIQTNAFKRLDIYLGYSRVQDTGDGRSSPTDTTLGPAIPAFQAAQTFPLVYQAPLVRLSFRISEKLRWNAGYQYFGYRADFATLEDYLAHTGYTSLTWSF